MSKILVYTIGVSTEGGGGRRVYMELCQQFSKKGVLATSWSILPIDPAKLYDGQYSFKVTSYFQKHEVSRKQIQSQREDIISSFYELVENEGIDLILFDTEYSYLEFNTFFVGFSLRLSNIKLAALIHDQIWKINPDIVSDLNEKYAASFTPYHKLLNSFKRIRKDHDLYFRRQSFIKALKKFVKNSVGYDSKKAIQRKKRYQKLDMIFSLTGRSAKESELLYEMKSKKAFGTDGDLQVDRSFYEKLTATYKGRFNVLAFSRISPEKNIDIILSIISEVKKTHSQINLLVGGMTSSEEYAKYLKKLVVRLGLQTQVSFLGKLTDKQMNAAYDFSDAFICCDVCDFNLSTYRAIRFGKPIIVSGGYDFPQNIKEMKGIHDDNYEMSDFLKSFEEILNGETGVDPNVVREYNYEFYSSSIVNSIKNI